MIKKVFFSLHIDVGHSGVAAAVHPLPVDVSLLTDKPLSKFVHARPKERLSNASIDGLAPGWQQQRCKENCDERQNDSFIPNEQIQRIHQKQAQVKVHLTP